MQYDTTLTRDELERAITEIEPEWCLDSAEASPAAAGQHAVYRLSVDAPDGPRDCYLKATLDGKGSTIDLEARILALLDAQTSLPVPSVYGLVDDHDGLPAPFALLAALPGDGTQQTETASLPPDRHRAIARDTGRHLPELHGVDAVDAFGFLAPAGPEIDGDSPNGDADAIAVRDPTTDWRTRVRDWADGTVEALRHSRFGDLAPTAERALDARIDDLEGPFEPTLARIDQSPENALVADGDLCGLIDWEFTVAATPAYDVVHVARSLGGGPFAFAPGVPDRRDALLEAVLAGYREAGGGRVVAQVRANRDCYELLCDLRVMTNLDEWYPLLDLDDQIDDAAAVLRSEVTGRL